MTTIYEYTNDSININDYIKYCNTNKLKFIPLMFKSDCVVSFIKYPKGILHKPVFTYLSAVNSGVNTTKKISSLETNYKPKENLVYKKSIPKREIIEIKDTKCPFYTKGCNNKHCNKGTHPQNWNPPCFYASTKGFCILCNKEEK
jgi:hypothetical protein